MRFVYACAHWCTYFYLICNMCTLVNTELAHRAEVNICQRIKRMSMCLWSSGGINLFPLCGQVFNSLCHQKTVLLIDFNGQCTPEYSLNVFYIKFVYIHAHHICFCLILETMCSESLCTLVNKSAHYKMVNILCT